LDGISVCLDIGSVGVNFSLDRLEILIIIAYFKNISFYYVSVVADGLLVVLDCSFVISNFIFSVYIGVVKFSMDFIHIFSVFFDFFVVPAIVPADVLTIVFNLFRICADANRVI